MTKTDMPAGGSPDKPDMPALWQEFKETEAAINSPNRDASAEDDDPIWERHVAIEEQMRAARPSDLPGLVVQLRLLQDVIEDSEPNEADEAMLAHVVSALAAVEGASS